MEILKFDNAATPRRKKSNGNLKSLAGLATVAAIAVLGSTLAANLSLNSGSAIEFGQGVSVTAACDSDGIVVTPSVRFINAANAGTFYLSTISLSSVDLSSSDKCVGKTFTLQAYDNASATPLQIATSTVNTSLGITQATFANTTGNTAVGTSGISIAATGSTASGSFTLGFGTPSATSGAVYKITLQSQ